MAVRRESASIPLMPESTPRRRIATMVVIWSAFGLAAAAQHNVNYSLNRDIDLPFTTSLTLFMPIALYWGLATPLIQRLGRRFPLEPDRWLRSVPAHALAATLLISLLTLWHAALTNAILPGPVPRTVLQRASQLWLGWMFWDGILYCAILAVTELADRQRRLRHQELNAAQLETQLAQAELQALRTQLQPHFLFNALHTIGALVRTGDRDNALRVVTGLGELLRRVLDSETAHEVRLEDELAFIRSYLAIEHVRFCDRLSVEIDAPPAVLDAMVPHLVLQPLVENAIRHGIAPYARPGRVLIAAWREAGTLRLLVRDDGPGGHPSEPSSGIGLTNTRARLERLYGAGGQLTFGPVEGLGHEVRVSLPWHTLNGNGA